MSKVNGETTILELFLDVTEAADLGEVAKVAVTLYLPDPNTLRDDPIICFAKPGGGYSRRYYTNDLPGPGQGSQAQWHTDRGWIFVAIDHLGVGESSIHDGSKLNFKNLPAANQSAEEHILSRLQDGTLLAGYPSVSNPIKIGIGQSMGGCMTIVQQGRYHGYDGIGILGFSAVHTHPPTKPGTSAHVLPWWPRDRTGDPPLVHSPQNDKNFGTAMGWAFHYDDVDPHLVASDLARFNSFATEASEQDTQQKTPEAPTWASLSIPASVALLCTTPGIVAMEAAAIMAPVLVSMGERDVIPDPKGEGRAYISATSVDLFICPRMGHMHNFASTRELFWLRLETWAEWVREVKNAKSDM